MSSEAGRHGKRYTHKTPEGTLGIANSCIVEFPGPSKGEKAQRQEEYELGAIDHEAGTIEADGEKSGLEEPGP